MKNKFRKNTHKFRKNTHKFRKNTHKFRKNTHKFRKNTHKFRKNIKKTLFFKGGAKAINEYYYGVGGPLILLTVNDGNIVENIFNPSYSELTWKQPSHSDISQTVQPYTAYNNVATEGVFPIFFKELPSQIQGKLYVPIYKYDPLFAVDNISTHAIMRVYIYVTDLLLKSNWSACLNLVQSCPFSPGLKSRAHRACCGFIAPALGVILHYIDRRDKLEQQGKVVPELTAASTDLAMRMGINFYANFTGYGTSENSWNRNCDKWSNKLKEGVNILTFYQRIRHDIKNCQTYHHFIVYVKGNYSIIIDSWAGMGGQRGEWARIMKTQDIYSILTIIGSTQNLETTNQLLNEYFIVPHDITIVNNIDENWQTQLLSVGAYNLDDSKWDPIIKNFEEFSKTGNWTSAGGK